MQTKSQPVAKTSAEFQLGRLTVSLPRLPLLMHFDMALFFSSCPKIEGLLFATKQLSSSTPEVVAFQCWVK